VKIPPGEPVDHKPFEYGHSVKKKPVHLASRKLEFIDKYLNRPLAGLIVKLVYNTRIKPDQITVVSLFIGLIGAFFYSLGEYRYFIIGGILFQASSIIDGADGMLARARGETSRYGAFLDLMFDRILDFVTLFAMSLGVYTYYDSIVLLIVGLAGAGFYLLQINIFYLIKQYTNSAETGDTGESRAFFIFTVFVLSLLNRLDIMVWIGITATLMITSARLRQFLRFKRKNI
jgi:phosphatidylglycerophosphate synthase